MAEGYCCSNCGKLFKGEAPLVFTGNLFGKLDQKFKSDGGTGDYCEACGSKIFASIRWDKD